MAAGNRPKLSLKTSGLTVNYNASTTSRISVNTGVTMTPTSSNTFANTFDLVYRPSPVSTISSPATVTQRKPAGHPLSATARSPGQPYSLNLPFGLQSILKNSPLPKDIRRPSACSADASTRISGRRVFFPPTKKVTFRVILEEEIVTTEYVKCHADLSSSDDESSSSELEEESSTPLGDGNKGFRETQVRVDEYTGRGRRKRKSVTSSEADEGDWTRGRRSRSRSTSARRTKRKKRRWEWTAELGPPVVDLEVGTEATIVGVQAVTHGQPPASDVSVEKAVHLDQAATQ
ncbi:hypothetical protein A1O1_00528 [Capronia coronata CBS 617.96]|uniref:Uncharacterized protein n=1 Tax=Capronia coronata CBS 617.96 TaxID=1182541 RepID=W9YRB4_9EURO|nr:uncharacterized protein A1O1_00528 [Capronia coronata CBS 617.96]EXJ95407.1 hypothetical protein A1O1_00528 [Capronia coronata CBS 617.96]